MREQNIDVLLLSTGAELPWLIGYRATLLERLTMLVIRHDAKPHLVIPLLEAPKVVHDESVFDMTPCGDNEDPLAVAASLIGDARNVAVSDQTWARFVLHLQ